MFHDEMPLTERHPPHDWEFADAAARNAFTGYDPPGPADVKKWCLQEDDNSYHVLTNHDPITWVLASNPSADVSGPGSSVDHAIARFDGVTGKVIQGSPATLSDAGNIYTPGNITLDGTVDGRDIDADGTAQDTHIADTDNPHGTTGVHVGQADPKWNADKLQSRDVVSAAPGAGDFLGWNTGNNRWEPLTPPGAGGGEANVSSHQGTGIDINLPKAGVDLLKKGMSSGSDRLLVDDDVPGKNVRFTVQEGNIVHQNLSGKGTYDHSQLDGHVDDSSIHFNEGSIDHENILNKGTNTHAQIDSHIGNATVHFAESSIDHENIQNKGTNTHAAIDSHISDDAKHREINDSGSGTTDLWSADKIGTEIANVSTKVLPIITTFGSNYGSYRTRSMGSTAAFRFTLAGRVPAGFNIANVTKAVLRAISVGGMTSQSIDVTTEYGGLNELPDNHTSNGVATVSASALSIFEINILPYIGSLAVDDSLGIYIDQLAVGTTNHYLGGYIEYEG